ncbi:hypothetical protein [Anatilimnocola aggregata]|uniref:hypothetical protein n=1 Tax=Anatilimnocola aggregata TaxID=2528021 RepID=UPI0011A2EA17|nr:hypothetical protein [Anatilimnocola aggregata]
MTSIHELFINKLIVFAFWWKEIATGTVRARREELFLGFAGQLAVAARCTADVYQQIGCFQSYQIGRNSLPRNGLQVMHAKGGVDKPGATRVTRLAIIVIW